MTPDRIREIGLARYGTERFLSDMSRDTGIPYRTLSRYARRGTDKPLVVQAIEGLVPTIRTGRLGNRDVVIRDDGDFT